MVSAIPKENIQSNPSAVEEKTVNVHALSFTNLDSGGGGNNLHKNAAAQTSTSMDS